MVKKILTKSEVEKLHNGDKVLVKEGKKFIRHTVTQPYGYFNKRKLQFVLEEDKCLVDSYGYFYKIKDMDFTENKVYKQIQGLSCDEIKNYFKIAHQYNFKYIAIVTFSQELYNIIIVENDSDKTLMEQMKYHITRSTRDTIVKIALANSFSDLALYLKDVKNKKKMVICKTRCLHTENNICCIHCEDISHCKDVCEYVKHSEDNKQLKLIAQDCMEKYYII